MLETSVVSKPEDDPHLRTQYNKAVARSEELFRKKILSYKDKLNIPSEGELRGLNISQLQDVTKAYNIPNLTIVVMSLLVADLSFTKKDAKQWEKMNMLKTLSDANLESDKYEKTI